MFCRFSCLVLLLLLESMIVFYILVLAAESIGSPHNPVAWFLFPCMIFCLFFVTIMFLFVRLITYPPSQSFPIYNSALKFRYRNICSVFAFSEIQRILNLVVTTDFIFLRLVGIHRFFFVVSFCSIFARFWCKVNVWYWVRNLFLWYFNDIDKYCFGF